MKVIVTGVTGQDGSYMAEKLVKEGHTVYGVIRWSSKTNLDNLVDTIGPNFITVNGDITDSQSIDRLVEAIKPDYFINFAANSFVGVSWEMPVQVTEVNTVGVINCLEAIRKFAPQCRFYQSGSSEEFGDVVSVPQDETHPLRPRSPYGASKAAARQFVKVYRESYNLFAIQNWVYNHESPRRGAQFVTRKITKAVGNATQAYERCEKPISVPLGNIQSKRDWSHAKDVVDAIWLSLNNDKPIEYVISSDETNTVGMFVHLACLHAGIQGIWNRSPLTSVRQYVNLKNDDVLFYIDKDLYRPAEVDLLHGNSSKIRTELGWKPKYSFTDLVKEMVEYDCGRKV